MGLNNETGFASIALVEAKYNDLLRRIIANANGDVMSDGSVPFTGAQTFQAGLSVTAGNIEAANINDIGTGMSMNVATLGIISAGTAFIYSPVAITFGDTLAVGNGTKIEIDDFSEHIHLETGGSVHIHGRAMIGDVDGIGNLTTVTVFDGSQTIDHVALHHKFNLQEFASDVDAGVAGLTTGDLYHTAGAVMVKA